MSDMMRALVVEDDAHSLVAITSILKTLQIDYKRNTTGSRVLEQALESRPSFVLLDMDLPGGDPFSICAMMRSTPHLSSVPVIAIGDQEVISRLKPQIEACCFDGCLTKPLSQNDLGCLLHHVLA